jgi:hypothetical protein
MRSSLCILLLFLFLQNLSAQENSIIEKTPIHGKEISTFTAMSFDILPGGGHFYLGNYISGSIFAVLKTGGIMSGYFFYQSWQKKKGRENGTTGRKKDSDRAAQRFTFSVFGATAAYGISWYKVYTDCSDINYRAQPVFEIGSTADDSGFCASIGLSHSF